MLVRKLRLQRGWSQSELAEMAGVTTRTIQRLERGHRPGLETGKALAAVFEVELSNFLPEEPDMNNELHSTDTLQEDMLSNRPVSGKEALAEDEREAMEYVQRVKGFVAMLGMYLFFLVVFVFVRGPDPRVLAVFGLMGLGIIVQGLVTFEKVPFLSVNWEKRLVEKRLGRRL